MSASKIPVRSIFIRRAEGFPHECKPVTVKTWRDAEAAVRRICMTAPQDGSYDKTDFTITWENGASYSGRFDAEFSMRHAAMPLADWVLSYLGYLAGTRRPAHTLAQDDIWRQMCQHNEASGQAKFARDMLDTLQIGHLSA